MLGPVSVDSDATTLSPRDRVVLAAQVAHGDALQTIHRARVMLSRELGLDPGPELTALQEQILREDDALQAPPEPEPVSRTCPYMGLVPYDVDDADGFFGRADDVDACLRKLADAGVLVVVGPSGAGKSSLVRAASRPGSARPVPATTDGHR